jgi:predicted dehydrogenase
MEKINWGILGASYFALHKMIPSMKRSRLADVTAIASRDPARARKAASDLGIPKVHESYESLLADPGIRAVYIPLPNHLHVEWAIRALRAGKHVLCEKPIGLNRAEAASLIRESKKFPRLKIMEAFMYRFHPQWELALDLVRKGRIGTLKSVRVDFAINITDPENIRNRADCGGGGLLDLGCYCVSFSRVLFGAEPKRAFGRMEIDPRFGTDILADGFLDFGKGSASFTCATSLFPYQGLNALGDSGRLEMLSPVTAPHDKPVFIRLHTAKGSEEITIGPCDYYAVQADKFCEAVLEGGDVPFPLTDAAANMKALDAVAESHRTKKWVRIG